MLIYETFQMTLFGYHTINEELDKEIEPTFTIESEFIIKLNRKLKRKLTKIAFLSFDFFDIFGEGNNININIIEYYFYFSLFFVIFLLLFFVFRFIYELKYYSILKYKIKI